MNLIKRGGCTDCRLQFHPVIMDMDHLPQYEKTTNIARMVGECETFELLIEELEKTEPVCANCHRQRGIARGDYVLSMTEGNKEPESN